MRGSGAAALLVVFLFALEHGSKAQPQSAQPTLITQTQAEADKKSAGCITCHAGIDEPTMHPTRTVRLGCTDCHGGDASAGISPDTPKDSRDYAEAKRRAHVQPRDLEFARGAGSVERPYTKWLRESTDYVRFANPGDLRVAPQTCGTAGCHAAEVRNVSTSMMTHGGMLWGAALYNNGSIPVKNARFGESYSADGLPQTMKTVIELITPVAMEKGLRFAIREGGHTVGAGTISEIVQ